MDTREISNYNARAKLRQLRQGKNPVDEYVAEFRILSGKAKMKDDKALTEYFMEGINTAILQKIFASETLPTTIEEWYTRASKHNAQYRRVQEILERRYAELIELRYVLRETAHFFEIVIPPLSPYRSVRREVDCRRKAEPMRLGEVRRNPTHHFWRVQQKKEEQNHRWEDFMGLALDNELIKGKTPIVIPWNSKFRGKPALITPSVDLPWQLASVITFLFTTGSYQRSIFNGLWGGGGLIREIELVSWRHDFLCISLNKIFKVGYWDTIAKKFPIPNWSTLVLLQGGKS